MSAMTMEFDGVRELSMEEIDLVTGADINWSDVGVAAGVGAVSGAAGGAVAGALAGGVGAVPGAVAGAVAGAVGGAVTTILMQMLSSE